MSVLITGARILTSSGTTAAEIAHVAVGGGVQVKTVDGEPVEFTHPYHEVYHTRLIAPDRSMFDTLVETATFEDAVSAGEAYATKLEAHAAQAAALAESLR